VAGWTGLALGFIGVAALVGLDIDTSDRVAVLQLLVVVIGYAIGPMILVRSLSEESGLAVVGLSFGAAAIGALGVLAVGGGWPTQVPSTGVLAAVAVLVVVCTVGGFLMLFALVGHVGAVRSTAVTYVNPAVAIAVGAIFLGERITTWTIAGFALVLAGSVLLTRRPAVVEEGEPVLVEAGEPVLMEAPSRAGGVVRARWRSGPRGRPAGRPLLARRR
jgi:drug/metabolite transporter (DMT)-like permease